MNFWNGLKCSELIKLKITFSLKIWIFEIPKPMVIVDFTCSYSWCLSFLMSSDANQIENPSIFQLNQIFSSLGFWAFSKTNSPPFLNYFQNCLRSFVGVIMENKFGVEKSFWKSKNRERLSGEDGGAKIRISVNKFVDMFVVVLCFRMSSFSVMVGDFVVKGGDAGSIPCAP